MHVSSGLCRNIRLLVLAALLVSALSASVALAKGPQIKFTGSGKSWVAPSPVTNGVQFTVYGSGFQPGQSLAVFISDGWYLLTNADSAGNISVWAWAQFLTTGTKTVNVYQSGDRHMTVLSSCTFQVL